MKVPCKDCNIMHIGCHSDCNLYNKYKEERDKINKLRRQETEKYSTNWIVKGKPTNLSKFRKAGRK